MATLPSDDLSKYTGKAPKGKGKKATPKPWDPFHSPLPSLQAIRLEAQKAAQAEIQAALGALPNEDKLRQQTADTITNLNAGAQQASQDIAGIGRYGVDQTNQRIGQLGVNPAGVDASGNPVAMSAAGLIGATQAATGNTINAAAAGARLLGNTQGFEAQKALTDKLSGIQDQRTAIKATGAKAENDIFSKLREFYFNIAGAQQQNALASSELQLNADKAQADALNDAQRLRFDQDKLDVTKQNNRANQQIALAKLRQAAARLDLDAGRLALDQGKADFDQWYDQQRLDIMRWSNRIRQTQVELAIDKAKTSGNKVDRKSINSVFNNIDSMYNKRDKGTTEKVTSFAYTFYGASDSPNPNNPPVKAFTVRGKDFDEAFAKAKSAALSDGYVMPANWHQNVGAEGDTGYGPAFREERRDPQTETITTWAPRYKPEVILQTAIQRLVSMGYSAVEAQQVAGAYVKSLIPYFQLNTFYGRPGSGRRVH